MGSSASKTASSASSSSNSALNTSPETKFNSKVSSSSVPKAFTFPMPSIHHPPAKKGDTHHFVSLTSSTYGSLLLDGASDRQTLPHLSISGKSSNKKTPETEEARDSLSPDSVINTWELMNGLDEEFDLADSDTSKRSSAVKSDSFSKHIVNRDVCINGSALKLDESYEFVRIEEDDEDWRLLPSKPKQPLWKHMSEESFLSDLDPNIISSYKKALSSKQLGKNSSTKSLSCSHSNQSTLPESVSSSPLSSQTVEDLQKPRLLEAEDNKNKIVLYFTSLRGIRKTYEDCCCVRTILRGFQIAVEERDISMDSKYRKELQIALGEDKPVCLPQVFIRGIRIGGIEEIKKLNDGGELGEMLKGFPACETVGACDICGDARFVPCTNCGGSTKVFEEQEDGFKRCEGCNENGLVRCNKCCL
ncbi:hypothetical protein CARUB_v10023297mg [Capsella rubella]|uniref:Glutaredoxin domain-containing protein n=1 Tax=Capsella rubella TaxID=81985 RepID=R0FWX8_9BRAS|nr:uncharacterized protein At5g39865 [Capsella rubella]EOA27186.1 hypothetical protein CARUB_v10023297mg [Capsella rubella]